MKYGKEITIKFLEKIKLKMLKTLIIISSLNNLEECAKCCPIESDYTKYAKHIPYEELYEEPDYFIPYSTEEFIIYQNKKLLKNIFKNEVEEEAGYQIE